MELVPSRATFALEDPHEYEASYVAQLEDLGVQTIQERLEQIGREAGGLPRRPDAPHQPLF
jgi:hypothetical protein